MKTVDREQRSFGKNFAERNMGDKMIPVDFTVLLQNIRAEYKDKRTVYGVPVKFIDKKKSYKNEYMDIELPFGPAAGPHTQMAQNIAAAYAGGARFFELKTVQILDGESMHINKPCISVPDECYNIEWSTELTIEQAFAEYVKAYFLLKFMAVEFGMGRIDGFSFNMSVGYDLQGIKSDKVNKFIDNMKDAGRTETYKYCYAQLKNELSTCELFSAADLADIGTNITDSITVSTMHGCPAGEIEKIAGYLLIEKESPVYVKLNPTLNGLSETQKLLTNKGYGYIKLIESNFRDDLKLTEAVDMLAHLLVQAEKLGRFFGVKLTNTLPVLVDRKQLPDEQMYLSGKPLFLLSLAVADKLANIFGERLPISFSGGLDGHNIAPMLEAGIYPLTMATVLLQGKGYGYFAEYADIIGKVQKNANRPQKNKINILLKNSLADAYYEKKRSGHKKNDIGLPMLNCKNCQLCIKVCPNRANIMLEAGGKRQIIHIDAFCNECGNCATFCPYAGKPYHAKFTIYNSPAAFATSENSGMVWLNGECKIRLNTTIRHEDDITYKNLLAAVQAKYMAVNICE